MSAEEGSDASRVVPGENEGKQDDQDAEPITTITNRGFSGAPKFSEFRRTVTSTNTNTNTNTSTVTTTTPNLSSNTTEENKDKPVTKARGINDGLDTSAVDEEMEDGQGLLEKISEQFSSVKQEIVNLTNEVAHEVKEFYDKAIKGERDP